MTTSLAEKLRAGFSQLTKSEKAVASYMLTHMKSLPYETAASIAESAGVSSMTVSRFLRNLGFNGLGDLKEHMRTDVDAPPLLISDRLKRIRKGGSRNDKLSDNIELEIQATLGVYELVSGAAWKRVVENSRYKFGRVRHGFSDHQRDRLGFRGPARLYPAQCSLPRWKERHLQRATRWLLADGRA